MVQPVTGSAKKNFLRSNAFVGKLAQISTIKNDEKDLELLKKIVMGDTVQNDRTTYEKKFPNKEFNSLFYLYRYGDHLVLTAQYYQGSFLDSTFSRSNYLVDKDLQTATVIDNAKLEALNSKDTLFRLDPEFPVLDAFGGNISRDDMTMLAACEQTYGKKDIELT
ncbi:MAG: hypothetical protein V4691_09620 [Pseudomonadota bacterium]